MFEPVGHCGMVKGIKRPLLLLPVGISQPPVGSVCPQWVQKPGVFVKA